MHDESVFCRTSFVLLDPSELVSEDEGESQTLSAATVEHKQKNKPSSAAAEVTPTASLPSVRTDSTGRLVWAPLKNHMPMPINGLQHWNTCIYYQ
jgi:hypothetical protein